ncbi:MAG: hypothetical protein WBP12_04060 [Candidatus Saccharimonas sp.]
MRYITLVLLNVPVVLLALVNLVTKYKTGKLTKERFRAQTTLWVIIFLVVAGSFPLYNYLVGNPPLQSDELTAFDIAQTTVIIFLIYTVGKLHQKIEWVEKYQRDLHQELSIRLSENSNGKAPKH